MATKLKPKIEENPVDKEIEQVASWRQEQFVKVLRDAGLTDDEIDLGSIIMLVDSKSSHWDLAELIEKGCDPATAIEILV